MPFNFYIITFINWKTHERTDYSEPIRERCVCSPIFESEGFKNRRTGSWQA